MIKIALIGALIPLLIVSIFNELKRAISGKEIDIGIAFLFVWVVSWLGGTMLARFLDGMMPYVKENVTPLTGGAFFGGPIIALACIIFSDIEDTIVKAIKNRTRMELES